MNLITIIIPCYNGEKYIKRCIKTLQNQTINLFDVIFVDDASTDHSLEKMESFHLENMKILKNKSNVGAGASRNLALKEVKTDYVTFLDIDDYYDEDYIEKFLEAIVKENADVLVCDVVVENEYVNHLEAIQRKSDSLTKEDFLNHPYSASPCNKVFKTSFFLKYPFKEGIMNEDIPTILPILVEAKNISYVQNIKYHYVQRNDSVQHINLSHKRLDLATSLNILMENVTLSSYLDIIIYHQFISFLFFTFSLEKSFKIRYSFIKKLYKKITFKDLRKNKRLEEFLNSQSKISRIYFKMMLHFFDRKLFFLGNLWISFYHFYKNWIRKQITKKNITMEDLVVLAKKQTKKKSTTTISVVIPNYNYERYLLERVYSILYQTEKIHEIIFLDDCSKDKSRELIDRICESISLYVSVKKSYNKTNSGSPFKQWEKGFSLATGDYVWICEADDYADSRLLSSLKKGIKKEKNIHISYTDTAYINKDGKRILKSIKKEIDILNSKHWNSSYIIDGKKEFQNYAYLNCTIANVSSVLFKNDNYHDFFKNSSSYRQTGDWLFYVQVMRKGLVSYVHKPYNYYRVHDSSVTTLTKKESHFNEIKKTHDFFQKHYQLNQIQKEEIQKRYEYLKNVWHLK